MQFANIYDRADDSPYVFGCQSKTVKEFIQEFREHINTVMNREQSNTDLVAFVMRENEGGARMEQNDVLKSGQENAYRLEVIHFRDILVDSFQEWKNTQSLEKTMKTFGNAFDNEPNHSSTLTLIPFDQNKDTLVKRMLDFHPWSGVKQPISMVEMFMLMTLTYHSWKNHVKE